MRDKPTLLQELQHRVANSLQIISSILLQSARKVQSEESRSHLYSAHNRLQSIANVQKQLSETGQPSVALRSYFTDLCRSIGDSIIHDSEQISIRVAVDDSVADGDTSVSLGLIVTDLMINALKHAFPGQRKGRIVVNYHAMDREWTLSVSDNGVGMPKDVENHKPGLGTGIIEALAKQLDARIDVTDSAPGTLVSLNARPVASKPILRAV
ncbi:MAG: sensor histidine kinase [Devosia sp.]